MSADVIRASRKRHAVRIGAVALLTATAWAGWTPFQEKSLLPPGNCPFAFCGAPGTDLKYIAEWEQRMWDEWLRDNEGGERYFVGPRWPGGMGSPITLSWSIAPDGLSITSISAPSEMFARMDSLFSSQGGRATWMNRLQQSFDRWTNLTGIEFVFVNDGVNDWDDGSSWNGGSGSATCGDIRLAMGPVDGSNNILAFAQFPGAGSGGNIVMDRAETWSAASNQHRFMRNTVMHETGHSIGMSHVCPLNNSKLMEPALSTSFLGPQQDDIRGAQELYGDIYEDNNGVLKAYDVGTLAEGAPIVVGDIAASTPDNATRLSMDADGERDWFSFTVDTPGDVTITVTPVGSNYDSSVQLGSGSCSSGNFVNALRQADLAFDLYDTDGTTVLNTADAAGLGTAESLVDEPLAAAGAYFIRVFETNAPSEVQLYQIDLSFIETTIDCPGDVNGDLVVDLTDLAVLLANFDATGATREQGDLDGSGTVDLSDLAMLLANFGVPC